MNDRDTEYQSAFPSDDEDGGQLEYVHEREEDRDADTLRDEAGLDNAVENSEVRTTE